MYASRRLSEPVLTFLTQSPQHSELAQNVLQSYFKFDKVSLDDDEGTSISRRKGNKSWGDDDDELNEIFFPFSRQRWHSSLSLPRVRGNDKSESSALLHFISLDDGHVGDIRNKGALKAGNITLIAITDTNESFGERFSEGSRDTSSCHTHAIEKTRDLIASNIRKNQGTSGNLMWNAIKITTLRQLGKEIKGSHITGLQDGLPMLQLPGVDIDHGYLSTKAGTKDTPRPLFRAGTLREVVLPFLDDFTYPDGTTLLTALSKSSMLQKPMTGLYQWPSSSINQPRSGLVLRPLPVGAADMFIPPPTLIFQCDSLEAPIHPTTNDDRNQSSVLPSLPLFHAVGRNSNSPGQLMVHQEHVNGVDLRFCQASELSSSFAEAQDSLLAGSIADLQNAYVMVEGGNVSQGSNQVEEGKKEDDRFNGVDAMNGLGDCWVEFRANMKNPRGFFTGRKTLKTWSRSSNQVVQKVAKPPDLPYE